jgi:hypothetical protein
MAEMKTQQNDRDVVEFLNGIENEQRKADSFELLELFSRLTGEEAKMWGDSLIGFGEYHYKYASGREGDWPLTGFSPRKQNLTIYIMPGFERYDDIMKKLGKYKTGSSCLYVKKLTDIDQTLLKELVVTSVSDMKKIYSTK